VNYPLRISLNPFIADIGSLLPELISGLGRGVGGDVVANHRTDSARSAALPGYVISLAPS